MYLQGEEVKKQREEAVEKVQERRHAARQLFESLRTIQEGDPISLILEKAGDTTPDPVTMIQQLITEKDMQNNLEKNKEGLQLEGVDSARENEEWVWRLGVSNIFSKVQRACGESFRILHYPNLGIDYFTINDVVVAIKIADHPVTNEIVKGCSETIYKEELFSLTERSYYGFKNYIDSVSARQESR